MLKLRFKSLTTAMVLIVGAGNLGGCSSISFFPTAPAQKAADKVIDDIWPAPEVAKAPASPATASSSKVSGMPLK